jgi:hypothetical protein
VHPSTARDLVRLWFLNLKYNITAIGHLGIHEFGPGIFVGFIGKVRVDTGGFLDKNLKTLGTELFDGIWGNGNARFTRSCFFRNPEFHVVVASRPQQSGDRLYIRSRKMLKKSLPGVLRPRLRRRYFLVPLLSLRSAGMHECRERTEAQ